MENYTERNSTALVDGLFLMAITFAALIVGQLLSVAFMQMIGISIGDMLSMGDTFSQNITAFKWLQILSAIITFVLPALLFSKYKTGSFTAFFRHRNGIQILPIALAGLAMAVSYPMLIVSMKVNSFLAFPESMRFLEDMIRGMEDSAAAMTTQFLTMESFGSFALNMLMVGVLPAIGEELLFRGCIQKLFQRGLKNPHLAIFFASVIFSFFHFQFYGFLPRMIMGMILGYLFYYSGNIWYPILAHFFNNGFQVLMVYLGQMPLDEISTPELPPLDLTYLAGAAFSILLIGLVFRYYRKHFLSYGIG